MTYRPDIDGLRAVAVCVVVLFHAAVPGFAGGYIGVDVFFVISGFLVTGLLLQSSGNSLGKQLQDFYWRRARRILPALFLVCTFTAFAALYVCLPDDLVRLAKFLVAAPLLASNLAAWTEQDYFHSAEFFKPLLHLWSIGIEEQFYLTFPILLFVIKRYFNAQQRSIIAALALCSLAICCWASYTHPIANYFFPGSRAWELLLGAWIALCPALAFQNRFVNEILSAAALAALLLGACFYTPDLHYPGIATLVPAVATGALIVAGRQGKNTTSALLGSRLLVGIGLISYSLYLWHWPALAFFRYFLIEHATLAQRLLLIGLIFLVAVISWRLVELPLRRGAVLGSRRAFGATAALCAAALAGAGFAMWHAAGFPQRFSARVNSIAQTAFDIHPDGARCMSLTNSQIQSGGLCEYGTGNANSRRVLVWGDSHAMVLLPAWQALASQHGVRLYFGGLSSCRPLLPAAALPAGTTDMLCDSFNQSMVMAAERIDPDLIIFAAFWMQPGGTMAVDDPPRNSPMELAAGLENTLNRLSTGQRQICLVLDPPLLHYSPPYAIAMAERRGIDWDFIRITRAEARRSDAAFGQKASALDKSGLLQVVDLKDALCPGERCQVEEAGKLLYRDSNHLTQAGATFVTPSLNRCFDGL